jgi:uncharacterized protein (TIGR02271 family)
MQHTLLSVFDNRVDAQKAMDALLAEGYARTDVALSEGDPTGQEVRESTAADDNSITANIKHFFADLFGTDRSEATRLYSDAVTRGHYVLTLTTSEESEVERAADIVERFGPVDIDEKHQQWHASELQAGASARQSSAGMSQQFAGTDENLATQGGTPQGTISQGAGSMQRADTTAIPVIEEELKVGKRAVQRGGVRIYQRVVETPVNESVDLREEHVSVQRRATDKMVDPADIAAFQENTFEVREEAEEAVVEKSARQVEEVLVEKEVTRRKETITDTVRHTEVEVEPLSAADDDYFRRHWTSNYASEGGQYDEYEPAYRYGSQMRRSELYRGRPWEDVETDLRTNWEASYPSSAWERFKAAIREGWDRITS